MYDALAKLNHECIWRTNRLIHLSILENRQTNCHRPDEMLNSPNVENVHRNLRIEQAMGPTKHFVITKLVCSVFIGLRPKPFLSPLITDLPKVIVGD